MMLFTKCSKCSEHVYVRDSHKCKPTFDCSGPEEDSGDDWTAVYAYSVESAAEKYAEHRDSWEAEYPDERIVRVKLADGTIETYTVTAEAVRSYSARRNDEKPKAGGA